jgi:hypothetical protein
VFAVFLWSDFTNAAEWSAGTSWKSLGWHAAQSPVATSPVVEWIAAWH